MRVLFFLMAVIVTVSSCGGGTASTASAPAGTAAQPTAVPVAQSQATAVSVQPSAAPTARTEATHTPTPQPPVSAEGKPPTIIDLLRAAMPTGTVTVKDAAKAILTVVAMPTGSYATPLPNPTLKNASMIEVLSVVMATAVPGNSWTQKELGDAFAAAVVAAAFEEALKTPGAVPSLTSANAAKATPTPAPLTVCSQIEPCTVNGIRVTVGKVERGVPPAMPQFQKVEEGKQLLRVEVTVENMAQDEHSVNPMWFALRTGDGTQYSTSLGTAPQQIATQAIAKGKKIKGLVDFKIDNAARDLILIYSTKPMGKASETIRIKLDQ